VPLMVRLPGQVQPGSTSDAIVGPIDLYPTILQVAGLKQPEEHIVDGESLLPVLEQTGRLKRHAYFTWFPHLIPAVSVRQGDWKLIRRFEPHPQYPAVRELYNLTDDIGETQNLANAMPQKVAELDGLIDQFIRDTGALAPKPNPDFNADSKAGSTGTPASSDITLGLVARNCELVKTDGAIRVVGRGRQPFLGTAQVKSDGPLTLRLRARSATGGEGRIQWKTAGQETFPESGQVARFDLSAGASWQNITVQIPVEGRTSVVRLYLPAEESVVDVQTIDFRDKSGRGKSWDFSAQTTQPQP
ncbi:sulfatase/phosphatase domain-containing protein, partial [Stieleria sp.]|uniref:sulfatase/phosphatase domain-containing protein n=1 Tax=Stieleria sp. TaxID=2795976 RepID=UPI00356251F3